ncbi:MAG: BON domain-containing protein [Burkholderiaceae bacterium]|nr:BON domain-containing protein [Burkholderiaceae bacterium]
MKFTMKRKALYSFILVAGTLLPAAGAFADDVDASHPGTFIKDSAITTAIKAKLATEHVKSLKDIQVDTDDKGVVWLTGHARTDSDVKKAEAIARQTDGVRAVKNQIVVKADD